MARIQKQGLDYFPINTDFVHNRIVRRLMKQEGDRVLGVLLEIFSCLYGGEGYYVCADRVFCEDLASELFDTTADDVERIIRLAVEHGLFDSGMFATHQILTSADIQRQYLLCTKRRSTTRLNSDYCLLPEEEIQPKEKQKSNAADGINVTFKPENVTSGTQRKEKESKEKESKQKENTPLDLPCREKQEDKGCIVETAEGCGPVTTTGQTAPASTTPSPAAAPSSAAGKVWTQARIDALQPPEDGVPRNFDGLRDNLRLYRIPPAEQYAIISLSNYGAIGGKVWKGLAQLRISNGKIRLPGRFLLSVVNNRGSS